MLTILRWAATSKVYSGFCQPGLNAIRCWDLFYSPNDLYSLRGASLVKMKTIEVDDELYSYIASHTKHIGESASDIFTAYVEVFRTTRPTASAVKGDALARPLPKRNRLTR